MKIIGIYKIQSIKKPHMFYIGSSVNINKRWYSHMFELRHGTHHSKKLQNHYNKYGESDLQYSILLSCDKENIYDIEQFFLDSFNPQFNIYKTARLSPGQIQSIATKEKKRSAMLGKKWSEEAKKKFSEKCKGRFMSEETRDKLSKQFKGKPKQKRSEEYCKNISIAKKGEKNPAYKKNISIEERTKLDLYNKKRAEKKKLGLWK